MTHLVSCMKCYRNGQGFIFVYSSSNRQSFEEFTLYRETIMRVKEVERRLPLMIVGIHKSDKLRKVQTSEGKFTSIIYEGDICTIQFNGA